MDDGENKKTPEELADEALDKEAGGTAEESGTNMSYNRLVELPEIVWRDGDSYCPYCGERLILNGYEKYEK